MRNWIYALTAASFLGGPLAMAADKAPQQAEGIRTLFVDKGSASSVVKALNALHAKMEAEGWTYRDMSVYTEDGDLEGIFVTYVRAVPPADASGQKAPAQ